MNELPVLAAQPYRFATVLVDEPDDFLIEFTKHHLDHVHRLVIGHSHPAAEYALDTHLVEQIGDLRSAAMDKDRAHPDQPEHRDVAPEGCFEGGLGHRVSAILDDEGFAVETPYVGERFRQDLRLVG